MSNDSKIDITVRVPIVSRGQTLSANCAQSVTEQFKNQPITMGENVVGICRDATFDSDTGTIMVDAVIWATIGGLKDQSHSISFEISET